MPREAVPAGERAPASRRRMGSGGAAQAGRRRRGHAAPDQVQEARVSRRGPTDEVGHARQSLLHGATTDRLAGGVGGSPPRAAGRGEGAHPRPRRHGGQAPTDAVDGGREGLPVRGAGRPCEPGRPVRRPSPADRVPRLLRARRHDVPAEWRLVPGAGLRRLLLRRRPGRPPGPPERPGHDAGVRVARAPGRDPGSAGNAWAGRRSRGTP